MFPSKEILLVLVFIGCCLQGAFGDNEACSQANRNFNLRGCLAAIRQLAQDRSFFWFGDSYSSRCPQALKNTIDCFSPHAYTKSLSTALFGVENTDLSGLDRYIDVKFTSGPGSYIGCDYAYNQTTTQQFTINPLSTSTYLPWHLRTLPEFTWAASSSDLFTLIMFDPGFSFLHAFYVNIPGTNIRQGDVVYQYRGPGNMRDVPNPYVFVLYKQASIVDASSISRSLTLPPPLYFTSINLTEFQDTYKLGKLVGMTWLLASYDAYSVSVPARYGILQNCASLVENALKGSSHQRSFLPSNLNLSVALSLWLTTPATTYPCGNLTGTQEAADFYVDPLGLPVINTATARTGATRTYSMQMNKIAPKNTVDFIGKMYSLVYIDSDIPTAYDILGTADRPFLHGLMINIPGMDVASGTTLTSYLGPAPFDPTIHYYYFLLYEQPGTLHITNNNDYIEMRKCPAQLAGRCLFDIAGFVSSNNLKLVGATWFTATADDYATCYYLSSAMPIAPSSALTIFYSLLLFFVGHAKCFI